MIARPHIPKRLPRGGIGGPGGHDLSQGGAVIEKRRLQPLTDGVAFPGQRLFGAHRRGTAGRRRPTRHPPVKKAPAQLESGGPVGALAVELGDVGGGAAALQVDHRFVREHLRHAGLGK